MADKLLLSTLFLVLLHKGLMPTTVTVLVFGRDVGILVVAAILYAAAGRREFSPSIFGKGQYPGPGRRSGCRLLHQLTEARWVAIFEQWALWATMALTVASGLHYAWVAARRVGAGRQRPQRQVSRPCPCASPVSQGGANHLRPR